MSESVEIPDAAVKAAELAAQAAYQGGVVNGRNHQMRAALVAARPYLMPTREQTAEAVERELLRQGVDEFYDVPRLSRHLADVLALLPEPPR